MSTTASRPSRGRGRGVLGLSSFAPCPRPSAVNFETHTVKPVNVVKPMKIEEVKNTHVINNAKSAVPKSNVVPNGVVKNQNTPPANKTPAGTVKLLAKYKYAANPKQPGGFKELTIVQGEKLLLLQKGHPPTNNPLWWEVKNEAGQCGYVPGNYCLELEEQMKSLPWLENKKIQEEQEKKEREKEAKKSGKAGGFGEPATPLVKAYVSSYGPDRSKTNQNADELAKRYYCDICFKNLNGPQPYKMHMTSKAHKEEVERLKQS